MVPTYVGIRLVDQLLVALLGDHRRANQDGNIGEAGVGNVAEFIEDILGWVMKSEPTLETSPSLA